MNTITGTTGGSTVAWSYLDVEQEFEKSAAVRIAASMAYGWDPDSMTPRRIKEIARVSTWLAQELWSQHLLSAKTISGASLRRKSKQKAKKKKGRSR